MNKEIRKVPPAHLKHFGAPKRPVSPIAAAEYVSNEKEKGKEKEKAKGVKSVIAAFPFSFQR